MQKGLCRLISTAASCSSSCWCDVDNLLQTCRSQHAVVDPCAHESVSHAIAEMFTQTDTIRLRLSPGAGCKLNGNIEATPQSTRCSSQSVCQTSTVRSEQVGASAPHDQ